MQQFNYLDLSNNFYQKELPDLSRIDNDVTTLRLTALYLHDISGINHLQNLINLNISYTYIKNIPELKNLEELQMIEVELDDPNELSRCKKLRKLKMTHDDINLTEPLNNLEILHLAVLHRPDLLWSRFPNLKEIRFEHIHPKQTVNISDLHLNDKTMAYYTNLKYTCCKTSKTIIRLKDSSQQIDDFDDTIDEQFESFGLRNYLKEFANNRLEYCFVNKNLSHMVKHNIHTVRCMTVMNIYGQDGSIKKSFEIMNDLDNQISVRETISDSDFIKIQAHYNECYIYYEQDNEKYNSKNVYTDIMKKIIYNDYQLNDEIISLLTNFVPKQNDEWSVDKLLVDIRENGLTDKLIMRVKYFDKIPCRDNYQNESRRNDNKNNVIENSNSTKYYDLPRGKYFENLKIDDIKDILWFSGKKYLLTNEQKQCFINTINEENDELEESLKNICMARFENGKIVHYKLDEEGNEILVTDDELENCSDNASCHSDEETNNGQKQCFIDVVDKENNNFCCGRFEDGKIVHYKLDEKGNEIIITDNELKNCSDVSCCCDKQTNKANDSTIANDDDGSGNVMTLIQVPPNDCRSTYQPSEKIFNNIFMKDSTIISNNITTLDDPSFLNVDTIIPNRSTARFHLNFYGKAANFSRSLIENSNGYIMLGASGDEGIYNHMDALLDKNKDHMLLCLHNIFYIFKNRMYTNHLAGDIDMIDYTDDIVVLDDGTVGWGGTFYPFDVILETHPKVILERDIGIQSPLHKTVDHNHVYKCCSVDNK